MSVLMEANHLRRIGSIPFDTRDDKIALLFVTSQTRGRWILPKGLAKPGETPCQTCQRECFEEAGVSGVVLKDFPLTVSIGKQTNDSEIVVPVTFYPLFVGEQTSEWPEKHERARHWALLDDAEQIVLREDYRTLIRQFEALSPWIMEAAMACGSGRAGLPTAAQ